METKTITLNINRLREKRSLCNQVKTMAMNNKGILFGGVVRDDIIGKHYRKEFIKRELDFNKYWDSSYDEDTRYRLIVPNDIDIFFRAENNSTTFQNRLREFVKDFNGTFHITDDVNFRQMDYSQMNRFLRHKIININIRIGRTLFDRGININLKIDLIEIAPNSFQTDNYEYSLFCLKIEPPFNNLDFLCNSFIMEKNGSGDYITRISNSTGTPIDDMIFSEKTAFSLAIINDIINFKTNFVRSVNGFNTEYVNCYRILKMIDRNYSWTISNLPFRMITIADVNGEIDDSCCVCLEDIKCEDKLSEIVEVNTYKIKSNYLHKACFLKYLYKEQQQRYVNPDTNTIECRCPFRGFFNFKECHKEIKYE